MSVHPQPAHEVLDRCYLEIRSKLLDLAALFDRIDRGGKLSDPRLDQLQQALTLLQQRAPERAEKIQLHFSLPYDPQWQS